MNEDRTLTGVVIDAGHGGADSGAVGNGIVEKDLTLEISKYMYNRLKSLGIPVALTRDSDVGLNSITRPKKTLAPFGNGKDVLVISNHINAGGAEGAEVIYALRNSDKFSNLILNNLAKKGQKIRKAYQRRLPSNSNKDYYYMMRNTPNTESVIVEYGFLDNKNDASKLKNNYKAYADAVVDAILEYKGINKQTSSNNNDYYIVKPGDTLWKIARENGITVDELKSINNLNSNLLSVGDKIYLTNKLVNEDTNYYKVKAGDTLYSIAKKYNTTVDKLKDINNLITNTLQIGDTLKLPTAEEIKTYVVKAGDTLYSLARRFGVTVDELKTLNNLVTNILTINQKLLIP